MILQLNNKIFFSNDGLVELKQLPNKVFLIKYQEKKDEYFLEKAASFKLPKKEYGTDLNTYTARVLTKFKTTTSNVGALFAGDKGSGKSLLAKKISMASGLPVLIMGNAYAGATFSQFISSIEQPCIILIDEFEKMYDNEGYDNKVPQTALLSLLDGVYSGKKLFLLTANETSLINKYLFNRPGRIHYYITFDGLAEETIEDVIEDLLVEQAHAEELKEVINIFGGINMDSLLSIIEEMNLFSMTAKKAVSILNITMNDDKMFTATWEDKNKEEEPVKLSSTIFGHPLAQKNIRLYDHVDNKGYELNFKPSKVISRKFGKDTITVVTDKNKEVIFSPYTFNTKKILL